MLGDKVGRARILIVHGTGDRMIGFVHGEELVAGLNAGKGEGEGVRSYWFEGLNHVAPIEKRAEFGRLVEELVDDTEAMTT